MGPVLLTNTHSVGIAHHAAIRWLIRHYPVEFAERHLWALPVVGRPMTASSMTSTRKLLRRSTFWLHSTGLPQSLLPKEMSAAAQG
jgi:hypothetical protein